MIKGEIPFIGSSASNNGCTAYIDNNERLHSKNVITVCYNGSVGETFYQDKEFWASDDVNVLYPKFNLNDNNSMYFMTLIKKLKSKYDYSRKWTMELMKEDKIMLPVINESVDLEYISKFIYIIKKIVIKDVVEFKDRELVAMKQAIA